MITSKTLNEFEGDLSLLRININDKMPYCHGYRGEISVERSGHAPVSGLEVFELAKKARAYADQLINAADAMDLRINIALDKQENT